MKNIRIYDTETGDIEFDTDLDDGTFQLNYIENTDYGNLKRIGRISNGRFGDKHWIKNYIFEPIAHKLVEKFEELKHVKPRRILFLENTSWTPPKNSKKRDAIAKISILNAQMQAALGYVYMIEIKGYYIENLSKEQIVAVIYHELRHIAKDGELLQHDIEDWDNMVATLGKDWMSVKSSIVNILDDEEFDGWYNLCRTDKQMTLFDQYSNVKPFRKTADQG